MLSQKIRFHLTAAKSAARCCALALIAIYALCGQTLVDIGKQGKNIDFSNAPSTRPAKMGTALPGTCSIGQLFFNTAAPVGQNLYACAAPNSWTVVGSSSPSGLSDPGTNGVVTRTAPNTTSAVPAPNGTIVGTTDVQTLTNKSIDASEVNSGTFAAARVPAVNLASSGNGGVSGNLPVANLNGGTAASSTTFWRGDGTWATPSATSGTPAGSNGQVQYNNSGAFAGFTVGGDGTLNTSTGALVVTKTNGTQFAPSATIDTTNAGNIASGTLSAARMPALTGDVTTAAGSTATTLANSGVAAGSCGDATHSCSLTFDAKGRATAMSNNPISGGSAPGDANTAVQFNSSGSFGGDAAHFNYNSTSHVLTATGGFVSTGSNAGFIQFGQGAANTCGANSFCLQAPAAIATAFQWTWPAADGNGILEVASDVLQLDAFTGTGSVVKANSPTLSGTTTVNNLTVTGTCTGCGTGAGALHTANYLLDSSGAGTATNLTQGTDSTIASVALPGGSIAAGECVVVSFDATTINSASATVDYKLWYGSASFDIGSFAAMLYDYSGQVTFCNNSSTQGGTAAANAQTVREDRFYYYSGSGSTVTNFVGSDGVYKTWAVDSTATQTIKLTANPNQAGITSQIKNWSIQVLKNKS
jgi:hypothetical protein